ncbi:MAG: non-canonical purine NTP pyrophosphatase [Candidatus Saccharimonadales bacterium]
MKINFITTNTMKFDIAKAYFEKIAGNYELTQHAIDTPEIQDKSVVEIARQSALWAAKETGMPCIKMDVGFYISALNGFPGPFVKYVNDWLTQDDFLKLMQGKNDRSAYFEDATAIGYPDGTSEVFSLINRGSIALSKDPENNRWPANLLFIPVGYEHALGSMSDADQNQYWGDGNWPKLIEFLERSS